MSTSAQPVVSAPPEEPIHEPAHLDGIAYLYGHPLLNSLSPPLHQTIYDALGLNWTQIPLSSVIPGNENTKTYPPPYTRSPSIEKFLAAIRTNPRFVGSSVTMPWKVNIMSHLDELTEDARQAGACNTIFVRRNAAGRPVGYVGTNTDCIGIREALLRNRLSTDDDQFKGKPAMIVGGGGTARTAAYVLRKWLGASKIYIVNRDQAEVDAIIREDQQRNPGAGADVAPLVHVLDAQMAESLEPPAAIVSGIPNYPPKTSEEIQAREVVKAFLGAGKQAKDGYKGVILEMCYHPVPWTEIAHLASGAGWKVILGSEALFWQGLEQAMLWTGQDIAAMPEVVERAKTMVDQAVASRATKSNL